MNIYALLNSWCALCNR